MKISNLCRVAVCTGLALALAGMAGYDGLAAAAGGAVPDDGSLTIDTLRPSELVLRLGLVGSYWQGDSPANVSVYADGTVIVVDQDEQLGYTTLPLPPGQLDDLLALAGEADPFGDVDYGQVLVTDVGSTRVEVHADQGDAVLEVWALDLLDGLNAEQRANRQRLLALVDALDQFVGAGGEPFVSDDVAVVLRPVLVGMGPDGQRTPWPLDPLPTDLFSDEGFHVVCVVVTSDAVGGLPAEIQGEHLWALPEGLGMATPTTVAAAVSAVLPGEKPCESYRPVEPARPLTPQELAGPPHDWTSPWTQGIRTTSHPFEEWMAVDAMARTVLPEQLGGSWDWNRWSWFEYRFAAAEVDGRRVIDFRASCTEFVTDEEPACTIDARFDAVTGELLEFAAA